MKFAFPRFGSENIEVDLSTIIEFPGGMPGFEDCRRFKLFHPEGHSPLVFWLQSLDDTNVVFAITDPALLNVSYELTLSEDEERMLCISPEDELHVAVMLSDEKHNLGLRANTHAPIAFNITKRLALQKPLRHAEIAIRA